MTNQLAISDLFTPATASQWLANILQNDATVGLQTTSWQSGGMARTIIQVMSYMYAQSDVAVSIMAQGGFLDFAATGSVTYVSATGISITQPVTPDPSVPAQNPTGIPGWLDLLADSVYNVQRIGATAAANVVAVVNTSTSTYGSYTQGTYHVANLSTGATYSNETSLSIPPSSTAGGSITGASYASPIQITTASAHGLASGAVVYLAGVLGNTNANGFFIITSTGINTFTLNGSSGNGAYISGGSVYIPQLPTFAADLTGTSGTSIAGGITQAVTANSGVSVWNPYGFTGLAYESNTALAARCRLKLQSLSPNGPMGAYAYFAQSASSILAALPTPVTLSQPITQAIVSQNLVTGVNTVFVANIAGAVSGLVQGVVTGATNASPIVIACTAHGLTTGQYATISGVQGNTNANGTWTITRVDANHFSLNSSTGNAAYTSGGSVEGGDLGEVDWVIQNYAVPDSVTAVTQSVSNWNVAIIAAVTVSQSYASTYATNVQTALAVYFSGLGIGGLATGGYVRYNDVIGILYAAGIVNGGQSFVKGISSLTINGSTTDVAFSSPTSYAILSPSPAITVTGV